MNIVDFIRTILESRGADLKILNAIPVYIQRAIIKLQHRDLFPPVNVSYKSQEVKNIITDDDGNVKYEFVKLPQDFREFDRMKVDGTDYFWFQNEWNIAAESAKQLRNLFTIKQFTNELTKDKEYRLILYPYPPEGKRIDIWYDVDGSESCFDKIDRTYWEAILTTVESDLGFVSKEYADSEVADAVNQHKNREGFGSFNKTVTKLKPSYFGGDPKFFKRYQ
jgi:hypothetical protein